MESQLWLVEYPISFPVLHIPLTHKKLYSICILPCHLVLLSIFMGTLRVLVVGENSILFICSKSKNPSVS